MKLFKLRYKRLSKIACLLCMATFLLGTEFASARADRYFVDYENNTGYYVDVNSIEQPSEHELLCDVYLVKLHSGLMYRYRTYFDTAEKSYEYQQAKIYNYETKKLISTTDFLQKKQTYTKSRMLQETVEFAQEWKRTHIHLTPFGENWE